MEKCSRRGVGVEGQRSAFPCPGRVPKETREGEKRTCQMEYDAAASGIGMSNPL
jgi:hypothetical protein